MIIAVIFLLAIAGVAAVGDVLTRPALRIIGNPPSELHAISVTLPTTGKESVKGWFVRGKPHQGAILLLHGVRSDRRQMVGRARFLSKAGYSVLLIDLPGHGESYAKRITFGANESKGVIAALAFLRQTLPGEKIGVIGVSVGAASLVLSHANPAPDAVVLESMYPTIADAAGDRIAIRLGPVGKHLAPLLLWQLPIRLGISADQLRPITQIGSLKAPVLIAAGTLDRHTPIEETRRIFAAAHQPKELWEVQGAAHVDLHSYRPMIYQSKILAFFGKYLSGAELKVEKKGRS
jgi:fermentation-respiration switch protein FrsA (DUF1100 family)